jgi:hypothetical protein
VAKTRFGSTPITWEQWQSIEKGDAIRDTRGNLWVVTWRDEHDQVTCKVPGEDDFMDFIMTEMYGDRNIVDEDECGIFVPFHGDGVEIVKKPS